MHDGRSGPRSFIRELRRRHVFRVGILYAVGALAAIEAADLLFPRLGLPEWTVQLVLGLAIVGLPVALVLAWAFEWTPEGPRTESTRPLRADQEHREEGSRPSGVRGGTVGPPAGPDTEAGRDRLLVLPFANISPDEQNEYFSDGLTDEIISGLSRIHALGVISRTSAMRLKATDKDVLSIGRELGVRYVVEGSVRKSGQDLRITARLVDAKTDQHLWAETYAGTMDEVFRIQERVAGAIASALRIELSPGEERELRRRDIEDPVAHESYLRARHEIFSFSREGLEKARRHILNALELVGDNELLLATLGHIHIWFLQAGLATDLGHLKKAEECAEAIFRLAPDSRHGHRLRGLIEFQRGDLRSARPHLEASLESVPDDPDTLATLGYLYCLVGREEHGLSLFKRLLAIDPLTPLNHAMPGFVAVLQGRFADAVEPYRTFLRMDDGGPFSMMNWVWILGLNDRIEEAEPVVGALAGKYPESPFTSIARALFHGLRREPAAASAAISPVLREAARRTEMFSRFLAECHALAGEAEQSLDWLEHAVEIGLAHYPYLSRIDPLLETVRGEPRFREILSRVESEWREFQA